MTQLTLFADLNASRPVTADTMELNTLSSLATLSNLATLIRDGRARMEAQSPRRGRPIQSIGDLAQSVLLRHDVVARRRAAANTPAPRTLSRLPVVSVQHAPAYVQVAS